YRQVDAVVAALDESVRDANPTVKVVGLQNSNTVVASQALSSLLGKVRVGSTGAMANRGGPGGGRQGGFGGGMGSCPAWASLAGAWASPGEVAWGACPCR
ncbi:MAG: hypothetical protein ACKOFW_19680, partial [Planctomycetaceae bacterium]